MKHQKHFTLASIFTFILLLNNLTISARDIFPKNKIVGMSSASNKKGEPYFNAITLLGGVGFGGKHNTCYLLKAKATLADKFNFDAAMFYDIDHHTLYNASFSFGNMIAFGVGMEWGQRYYFINRDSTFEKIKYKNTATGAYANYNSLAGVSFEETMNTYTLGISFKSRKAKLGFWHDKGRCWEMMEFKFEGLYAPSVKYIDPLVIVTQGTYLEHTDSYQLEGAKIKHVGFRLVIDTRLSSKVGIMMETGVRPGIKSDINDKGTFSNGYLRIGFEIGFCLGGRKLLKSELPD
ncbi:hypothetical protein BH09BAC5_BH09BAC5_09620 [soil metagenome]